MILIYHLENIDGKIQMVEWGRFKDGKVTGKLDIPEITEAQVLDEFNRGYWQTSSYD